MPFGGALKPVGRFDYVTTRAIPTLVGRWLDEAGRARR